MPLSMYALSATLPTMEANITQHILCPVGNSQELKEYCRAAECLNGYMADLVPHGKSLKKILTTYPVGAPHVYAHRKLTGTARLVHKFADADHPLLHIAAINDIRDFVEAVDDIEYNMSLPASNIDTPMIGDIFHIDRGDNFEEYVRYHNAALSLTGKMLAFIPEEQKPLRIENERACSEYYPDAYNRLFEAAGLLYEVDPDHALLHIATLTTLEEFLAAMEN